MADHRWRVASSVVVNLTGGFAEWQTQRLPVERPPDAAQRAGAP